jgi:TonB family protein
MIYTVATSLFLAAAAWVSERAAALSGRSHRWIWAIALSAALAMPAVMPWRAVSARAASTISMSAAFRSLSRFDPNDGLLSRLTRVPGSAASRLDAAAATLERVERQCEWIWILGSAALALFYALGSRNLHRRRRTWHETTVSGTDVLISPHDGPAVLGVFSPKVVIPEWALDLSPESMALMLRHEEEHRRSRDPLLVQLANAAVLLMPWNLAGWWIASRLRLAIEIDCDARVLRAASSDSDGSSTVYGQLLLTVATRRSACAASVSPAMFSRSSALRRRISAMYSTPRRASWVRASIFAVAALVLLTVTGLVPVPRAQEKPTASPAVAVSQDERGKGAYRDGTPGLTLPKPTHHVDPKYTREAMDAKIVGKMTVDAVVDTDGSIRDAWVVQSLDPVYGLDQAGLDAAKQWTFEPGTLDGRAVPVLCTLEFEFKLR